MAQARCPLMLLQCSNDPPLAPIAEALEDTPLGPRCVLRTFHDQLHGFCAGRGDWSDPMIGAAARVAELTTGEFFAQHLATTDGTAKL